VAAFFRAGIILFGLVESEAKGCSDFSEFLVLFERSTTKFRNFYFFKRELSRTFLNLPLLKACRIAMIKSKQEQYFNSQGYQTSLASHPEKCHGSSPYCFWMRSKRFINDDNFAVKCRSVVDNLDAKYFYELSRAQTHIHFLDLKIRKDPSQRAPTFNGLTALARHQSALIQHKHLKHRQFSNRGLKREESIIISHGIENRNSSFVIQQHSALALPVIKKENLLTSHSYIGRSNRHSTMSGVRGLQINRTNRLTKFRADSFFEESTSLKQKLLIEESRNLNFSDFKELLTFQSENTENELLIVRSEHICKYQNKELLRKRHASKLMWSFFNDTYDLLLDLTELSDFAKHINPGHLEKDEGSLPGKARRSHSFHGGRDKQPGLRRRFQDDFDTRRIFRSLESRVVRQKTLHHFQKRNSLILNRFGLQT
jgi:hypothetical protein